MMMPPELAFRPLSFSDADRVRHFLEPNSEGSCQHAFASLLSLHEKYGDEICEADDTLFIHRANLDQQGVRVYLAPMPGRSYAEVGAAPWQTVLDDAHAHGCRVLFHTLTEKTKSYLDAFVPSRFSFNPRRDLAEYIYESGRIAEFSGHALAKRRTEVRKLWNTFGDRLQISSIGPDDFCDICRCEAQWLAEHNGDPDFDSLARESRIVRFQLKNWTALKLRGIIARIDGKPVGFSYGAPVNGLYFDALIEKANPQIPGLYRALFQEEARQSASDYRYINREEDLGIPGLREVKMLYVPDILLEKYDAEER